MLLRSEIKNIIITTMCDCNVKIDAKMLDVIELIVSEIYQTELVNQLNGSMFSSLKE